MNMFLEIIKNAIELGLVYSLVVIAVFLSSRIINFIDLSVEGSFAAGGAIIAKCLVCNLNPLLGLTLSVITGALIGLTTGLIHTKLKINNLISGLIVTTAMFSINLKIAGSNLFIDSSKSIFSFLNLQELGPLIILSLISLSCLFFIKWFLNTQVGFMLKAVGSNPQLILNIGKSISFYKILGLAISNAMTALAGALFVQLIGSFSINGNIGVLVIALSGLILSEMLSKSIGFGFIFGAIIYNLIFATAIELQLDPIWNKLITSLIMLILLFSKKISISKLFLKKEV